MDGHPIVLKKRVKTLPVSKLRKRSKVVSAGGPWEPKVVGGLPEQHEGVESQLEISEVDAQQHHAEESFDSAEHRHDFSLPVVGPPENEQCEHVVPEHPEEKSAFLSAPKRTEHEAHRHGVVQVLPDVLKLVPVPEEQHKHQGDDPEGAGRVREIGRPPQFDISPNERHRRQEGRGKSHRHHCAPEQGGPHPFPEVVHQASVSNKWFCSLYFDGHFISISVARKWSPDALP